MDDDVWEGNNDKEIINTNKAVNTDQNDKNNNNKSNKDIFDDILDIHEKPIEQPKKPEVNKIKEQPKKQIDKKKKTKYVKPKQTIKLNKYDKEYDDRYDEYYDN